MPQLPETLLLSRADSYRFLHKMATEMTDLGLKYAVEEFLDEGEYDVEIVNTYDDPDGDGASLFEDVFDLEAPL